VLRAISLLFALLVVCLPIAAGADPAVDEVQACARRNLPETSARQQIVLEAVDASGAGQRIEAELLWRRSKDDHSQVLVRVERPPDLRGSAFLLLERADGYDLFSYLPSLQKVRRLTGSAISGSLFGTDFSYEDFQRLQTVGTGTTVTRLPDADLGGRPTFVIAALPPADAGSAYQRVVSWIDRETCVLLRADLEADGARVVKQLLADPAQVRAVGTRHIPHLVTLDDREKNTRTTLTIEKVELDVPLSDSLFSQSALTKGR
jgi:hypothetical protein